MIPLVLALGVSWHAPNACKASLTRGTDAVYSVDKSQKLVRYDLAKGTSSSVPAKGSTWVAAVIGTDALLGNGKGTYSLVGADGKAKWTHKAEHVVVVESDVAAITVTGKKSAVERIDAKTGKTLWTAPVTNTPFWIGVDGNRVVVAGKTVALAFDGATGKQLWTATLTRDLLWNPSIGGGMFVTDTILDTATGKLVAKLPDPGTMTWPTVLGKRVYYVTGGDKASVVAIDATGKVAWRSPTLNGDSHVQGLAAGGLVIDDATHQLRLLDLATGKPLASYGIAGHQDSILVGAAAPAILFCDGPELVALDPSAAGTDEAATITGTIKCTGCGDDETQFEFRIGDVTGKTDAKGAFSVKLTGRGKLAFDVKYEDGYVEAAKKSIVTLAGKGTYAVGAVSFEAPVDGD